MENNLEEGSKDNNEELISEYTRFDLKKYEREEGSGFYYQKEIN